VKCAKAFRESTYESPCSEGGVEPKASSVSRS